MQYDNETKNLIEQLDKQAKEIQAKINELKNSENKCVRWRAESVYEISGIGGIGGGAMFSYGDKNTYYYIHDDGSILEDIERTIPTSSSIYHYNTGNYFKTKKEAEKYKNNLIITQKLKDIALRLNDGVEINWNNNSQHKFYIGFQHSGIKKGELLKDINIHFQSVGVIYCLSDKFLETAIKEIGEKELIEYIKLS